MGEGVASGLILPALALALLGWMVPRLLARVFPEGVRPLLALAAVSALVMLALGMAVFVALYLARGMPAAALMEAGPVAAGLHFLRLGAISALFWGPVLILSVAGLPRKWVHETW